MSRHSARRRQRSSVVPFRRPARRGGSGLTPLTLVLPLAAFVAIFLHDGGPPGFARALGVPTPSGADREAASFSLCSEARRITCVVDGDTFWYRGRKIRIADINAPETSQPGCAREAALGARATERLTELLNAGAFSLESEATGRDRDRYGRLLREVTRGGESLGAALTAEGLAEPWQGRRGNWC
jgi:micrococcal nuclease